MAVKKNSDKKDSAGSGKNLAGLKIRSANVFKIKNLIVKVFGFLKFNSVLSIIFYIIWIPVGIFLLWFIVANFRLGAFDQLMAPQKTPSQGQPTGSSQAPTETTIPGIGKVNISCVQKNLNEEAIVKIVQEKSDKSLTDDEKSKLAPCIVEKSPPQTETTPGQ